MHVQPLQSHLTLCDPMDFSPPGSSVHGIPQARILEWVSVSCSRGSSQPRDQIRISCIAGRFFTTEPQGKPIPACTCFQTHNYTQSTQFKIIVEIEFATPAAAGLNSLPLPGSHIPWCSALVWGPPPPPHHPPPTYVAIV